MIYRGPGFLAPYDLAPPPLLPSGSCLSFSVFLCVAGSSLLTGWDGEGAKSYDGQKAWILYKSFITLCSTPYSEAIANRFTLHLVSLPHREDRLRERKGVAITSVLLGDGGVGELISTTKNRQNRIYHLCCNEHTFTPYKKAKHNHWNKSLPIFIDVLPKAE